MRHLKQRFRNGWIGLGLWAAATLLFTAGDALLWALHYARIGGPHVDIATPMTLFFHACLVLLAVTPYTFSVLNWSTAWWWSLVAMFLGFAAPGIGILLAALAFLLAPSPEEAVFEDEFASFRALPRKKSFTPIVNTGYGDDARAVEMAILDWLDVQPLEDIVRGDDFGLKRDSLNKLARVADAESVALLRLALEDEDPEIRFYASGALSRLEQEASSKLTDLKQRATRLPGDSDAHLELAQQYLSIAELNLFPRETEEFYRECALEILERLPQTETAAGLRAKALIALGQYERALSALRQIEPLNKELATFQCEALLQLERFDELVPACALLEGGEALDTTLERQAVAYWSGRPTKEKKV